jgi:hypothetical protein
VSDKRYLFMVWFHAGSAELIDAHSMSSLRHAVWRARIIPRHIIHIQAHEDRSDATDRAAALLRCIALTRHFLAAGILEERLHVNVHGESCCRIGPDEFLRRAEISLFPGRVFNNDVMTDGSIIYQKHEPRLHSLKRRLTSFFRSPTASPEHASGTHLGSIPET